MAYYAFWLPASLINAFEMGGFEFWLYFLFVIFVVLGVSTVVLTVLSFIGFISIKPKPLSLLSAFFCFIILSRIENSFVMTEESVIAGGVTLIVTILIYKVVNKCLAGYKASIKQK